MDWKLAVKGERTWSAFGDGVMGHIDQHAALRRTWLAEQLQTSRKTESRPFDY